MSFLSWHRILHWRGVLILPTGQHPGKVPPFFRLAVRRLEDRAVPSTVTWIAGNGDWDTAANWLDQTTGTHHVPTSADDAEIDVTTALITVTHDVADTDSVNSVSCLDNFEMSAGSLTVATSSTFSKAVTLNPNGTLACPATLTVNGLFTLSGGTLEGVSGTGSLLADGGTAISGNSQIESGFASRTPQAKPQHGLAA